MISKMYVTLFGANSFFFSHGGLDVRGFCDKGNVAEAMEKGCGIRGAWPRGINRPPVFRRIAHSMGICRTHTRGVKA